MLSVSSGYEPAIGDLHRRGSVPSSPGSQNHQVPAVKGVQPFLGQQPRLSHGEFCCHIHTPLYIEVL